MRRIDASGSPVLASGTMSPPGTPTFPTRWKMNVGLYAYGVQTGRRAHFDDVLVRSP